MYWNGFGQTSRPLERHPRERLRDEEGRPIAVPCRYCHSIVSPLDGRVSRQARTKLPASQRHSTGFSHTLRYGPSYGGRSAHWRGAEPPCKSLVAFRGPVGTELRSGHQLAQSPEADVTSRWPEQKGSSLSSWSFVSTAINCVRISLHADMQYKLYKVP